MEPLESHQLIDDCRLFYRIVGQGQPLIVLHGGPDFDHHYLLPDLDRLAEDYRLIYYDQRGRGYSAVGVRPEDVSLTTEMADLHALQDYLHLSPVALLGHSWGCLLALEYALRCPGRVSHLVLMNPSPVSHAGFWQFRQHRRQKASQDFERQMALAATDGYAAGDLAIVADYYRLHFRPTINSAELLERLLRNLMTGWTAESILQARAIEARLYDETWLQEGYDLLPALATLAIPTLVVYGDLDFIPREVSERIASSIPETKLVVLEGCGHFAYIEKPHEVQRAIGEFFNQ